MVPKQQKSNRANFCRLFLPAYVGPIFIFERPFGVDWIGFSTLATNVGQTGTFEVQAPNSGLLDLPPHFQLCWRGFST